jgi:hypothetical protein
MKPRYAALTVVLLVMVLAAATLRGAAGPPASPARDLIVHEWGTFLAMSGSDRVSLDGMYHEEHALPGFVHARSTDQLRLPAASLKAKRRSSTFTRTARKKRACAWTFRRACGRSGTRRRAQPARCCSPPRRGGHTGGLPVLRDGRIC